MLADVPKELRSRDEIVLEAGEVFGEMSALSRYPVSADVVARTDAQCLLIRTSALRLMFKQKDLAEFKKLIDTRSARADAGVSSAERRPLRASWATRPSKSCGRVPISCRSSRAR